MTEQPPLSPQDPTPTTGLPAEPEPAPALESADEPDLRAAPHAVGEVVNGDPPVPITLWHIPAAAPGMAVSGALTRRLRSNYAHRDSVVLDLTADRTGPPPADRSVALVITTWPQPDADVTEHLATCAAFVQRGGCVAIVVTATDIPDQLGLIITAAREAGLTYLQHIVVAHHLTPGTPRSATRPAPHTRTGPGRLRRHLRVHTDVLLVSRPRGAHA